MLTIGTTTTTITPTTTNAILAIDASTLPISLATAAPRECPLVPKAKPLAIGSVI